PGTVFAEACLARPGTERACLIDAGSGSAGLRPPAWAARCGAGRLAALAYSVKEARAMREHLAVAAKSGIGLRGPSDGGGGDPGGPPARPWDEELAAAKQLSHPLARSVRPPSRRAPRGAAAPRRTGPLAVAFRNTAPREVALAR